MKLKKLLRKDIFIFTIGLALICYPIVSNYFKSIDTSKLISTYDNKVTILTENQKEKMLEEAKEWNNNLYLQQRGIAVENNTSYEDVLDIGNGVIGTIEIPQIDVNIPVYHGTSDSVLNTGAGHVEDSSLPLGGNNTHTVITGHSGLPSNKLFTRLDELEKNDKFYIYILDEVLAYEIDKIEIVLPEKADYTIEDGKDLATLVTCTPYGINTHRLLVTGHRIQYDQGVKDAIRKSLPSSHELIIYTIPLLFVVLGIIIFRKKGAKK
ncbi:class C sortase [Thomasclavelia cocleata]|uniref:LPXTG-site transpeptidase (Sortase) family protein n=1 Tax=Thomasclavelia cocleata TaxID=69824 RepID=A0A1I0CPM9_9FIRM|nr:class C sortase [Thomasclavelia cocleata]MCR1960767.1 class C sortase [Thomasclavelia cocleata]NDO42573.1 class C sortase [Thomasclavelia cocleata]PJN81131.1 class C sortase [Thomasclavelia cocleata]SET20980.1 LPXTG-site transpeptidase (sortase) family protein [Thomasclavelia cocleata]